MINQPQSYLLTRLT